MLEKEATWSGEHGKERVGREETSNKTIRPRFWRLKQRAISSEARHLGPISLEEA